MSAERSRDVVLDERRHIPAPCRPTKHQSNALLAIAVIMVYIGCADEDEDAEQEEKRTESRPVLRGGREGTNVCR